ncbi:hypothetical protein [uncultured Methanobrevibacter sp.]|uniref:hypothetical protein n=1 Tax=uncultured Methanobrevibacter sp. TaxID=253161 RepID=UPI00262A97E9|nr:hypothetical protein [uncultured Methanobrevibacter sp.]
MMFYKKKSSQQELEEDEIFYWIMMNEVFGIYSPFEIDKDMDFPNKEEIGGVILKFIGGGAAYFKIQREMPSDDEVKSVYETCQFLQESFGDYICACIICEPDIEIRDINVLGDENIHMDYVSARNSKGDIALEILTKKLENRQRFTVKDHVLRIILPFMGRSDEKEFHLNYDKFLSLYTQNKKELPNAYMLTKDMLRG